ncbi:FMN-binding domain-containing protein [Streptomyces sp. 3213]|uniref:FMN-binding protein n=1 Tax=Streptomyces sp. 3213.3 TaxID=1855348 RepID=UPI000897EAE7|nr:FMN-binding protein [Streptomyces sp. 3213.3]SEE66729.1 FMN-binding domain-containing protein [Streptomyces sp. 3213] [Streptomyces sp. 3213.3]
MKRVIPVLVLSVAGLIPVWRYEPSIGTTTSSSSTATTEAASTPTPSASSSASGSTSSGSAKKVVQGTAINTDKGTVQVQVTFEGDRISAVSMLQQPDHPQTTAAVPVLIEETLKAQSSKIDTVSGATITSDAYVQSLQAAIDAKGA